MALAGVRVLDLYQSGRSARARILGDLGADVIRVEATWSRGQKAVTDDYAARTGHDRRRSWGTLP